jgi:peptidoglycan/LPS O-acetylase OafA/YrhL
MQIYDAYGGKVPLKDTLKFYLRKIIRLAPMLYFIFFMGWALGARFQDSPFVDPV